MSKWVSPGGRTQEFDDTVQNERALTNAGWTKAEAKKAPVKKKAAAKKAK